MVTADCSLKPSLQPNMSVIKVHQGDNVVIECLAGDAASGNDHTYLRWLFNHTMELLNNTKTKTLHDRHQFTSICDVEQLKIQRFQEYNSGKYTCLRKTFITDNTNIETTNTDIKITMIKPSAPKIHFNVKTKIIEILYNSMANLTCHVVGSPIPQVQWLLNNNSIKECKHVDCSIEVTAVKNVTYTCVAHNSEGATRETMHVVVLVPPELLKSETSVAIGHINCVVHNSYPTPIIQWQYQHTQCSTSQNNCTPTSNFWINITDQPFKVTQVISPVNNIESRLTIHSRPFNAFVRCTAINQVGNDSHLFNVYLNAEKLNNNDSLIAGIICGTVVIVLIIILAIFLVYRRWNDRYSRFMSSDSDYQLKSDINLMDQGLHLPYDTSWEYPRNKLEFIKILGAGAFGQVWLARAVHIHHYHYHKMEANGTTMGRKRNLSLYKKPNKNNNNKTTDNGFVAVKTLKDDATEAEYKDLASEIKVLIFIGKNKNIVNLLGACTRNESLFAIIEYCPHGDLKNFLKSKRSCYSGEWATTLYEQTDHLTLGDLSSIAYQIAKGMAFLHSKKLVHRDLATRNILLGEDYCVKISDFGLARNISLDDNYLKTTGGLLPVKWMSPESLIDRVYNTKTDVWSFAITLWEVFTLGGTPYPGIPVETLFDYIHDGNRMTQPEICPMEMFNILTQCWSQNPSDRCEFPIVVNQIQMLLNEHIEDNPYLRVVMDDEEVVKCTVSDDSESLSSPGFKANKKFSLAGIIDFVSSRKLQRPLSHCEDHLLNSRLSSTNSDVFEKSV